MKTTIIESVSIFRESLSYTYNVPGDEAKCIYDFYLWALYYQLMKNKIADDSDTYLDLKFIVNDAIEKITTYMKEDLDDALFKGIISELGNILEQSDLEEEDSRAARQILKSGYIDACIHGASRSGRVDATEQFIKGKGWSRVDFADFAIDAFGRLNWNDQYGGEKWAEICDGYVGLLKSKTIDDKIAAIDLVFSLQHNTGSAINKVQRYKGINLKRILDNKFKMSPMELVEFSSIPKHVVAMLNKL